MKNILLSIAITTLVSATSSIAQAAPPDVRPSPSAPVQVMNGTSNPVPVTGTVNVNVTNPPTTQTVSGTVSAAQSGVWSVEVSPLTPITGGGQKSSVSAGDSIEFGRILEVTALSITFTGGASDVLFWNEQVIVGRFNADASPINLALSRPIAFDQITCGGSGGVCRVGYIGNIP